MQHGLVETVDDALMQNRNQFKLGRDVKHFKIHTVDIASNFNKLKIILIRITS